MDNRGKVPGRYCGFSKSHRYPTFRTLFRRLLSVPLFGLIFFIPIVTYAQLIPDGDGTEASPYRITKIDNLIWLSQMNNSSYWDDVFCLMNDIDAGITKTSNFTPIGNSSTNFTGKFHGRGHKISHLNINASSNDYVGLFGVAKSVDDCSCQIDSLGIDSSFVYGANRTGALAGVVYGICISNCFVTNTVVQSTKNYVGGMIGEFGVVPWSSSHDQIISYMSGCFTAGGSVSASESYVGGLIGSISNSSVYAAYSRNSVTSLQGGYAGGLIGVITGGAKPSACYSTGVVKGASNSGLLYGSGPAGNTGATTENCFWDTESSGGSNVQVTNSGSGKSSAEMKQQGTYTNWNFESVWTIDPASNDGYPIFRYTAYPSVATVNVQGVIDSTHRVREVSCNGTLTNLSAAKPTAHGFCYAATPNPTTANNVVNIGAAATTGPFSAKITNLTGSDTTMYYVRAFATNAAGTFYGEQHAFCPGVISYHWQPSLRMQPANGMGKGGNTTFIGKQAEGDLPTVADSTPLWLDRSGDGKRYVVDLKRAGDISYGYTWGEALTDQNHTFYVTAKNTVPNLSVVYQRGGGRYSRVRFRYANDTVYASHFDKGDWKATFAGLASAVTSHDWVPYFVHIRQVSRDSLRVSFGAANQEIAAVMAGDTSGGTWNAGSAYCWVTSDSTSAKVADVHVFSASDTTGVENIWRTFFSPEYLDNGPLFRIPMVIHDIIYDPPGSDSYESVTFDSSTSTKYQFDFNTNADLSLEVGVKGSADIGIAFIAKAGVSLDVQQTWKGEYHYQYDHSHGTEFTFNNSTATSSMIDNVAAEYMGPARGDVVVYQSFAYRTSMMRRPYISKFRTASDAKDFVYASAGGIPVPDSCSAVYYKPIQTLVNELRNDSNSLAILQNEYPFDLKTGKVLPSAFDSTLDHVTNVKTGPRLVKYEDTKVIGGNITHHNSVNRGTTYFSDRKDTWGYALTFTQAMWVLAGYEFSVSSSSSWACGYNETSTTAKTLDYELKDNTSWDILKITPYTDTRFNTVCFVVDSANSYTSFPVEANTRPSVSWEYSAVPACTAYVGQAATMVVKVTNTSPKAIVTGLPDFFKFSISAVNFPGTFSVYPEDAQIALGETVPFTFTFTGAEADSFMQEIRVDCWQPLTNGYSQYNSIRVPMVVRTADVGLVAVIPVDTVVIDKKDAVSNVFRIKLVNTGKSAATVICGEERAGTGATATYGSITNPVNPGDTTQLAVTLSGNGKQDVYSATFWTQIQDAPETRSLHTVVIIVRDLSGVRTAMPEKITRLSMRKFGTGKVAVQVPENEFPKLRIFSIDGRIVHAATLAPGGNILDISKIRLPNGYYVLQLQGRKQTMIERIAVSGR